MKNAFVMVFKNALAIKYLEMIIYEVHARPKAKSSITFLRGYKTRRLFSVSYLFLCDVRDRIRLFILTTASKI